MQIVVKNINFTYGPNTPFERQALMGIDFSLPASTYTAIIGHTGSGKSTLIQLLSGLLTPTSGTIQMGEIVVDHKSKSLQDLRNLVGMVFQYPEHQLFAETVKKDVAFGPMNQGLSEEEVESRVLVALERVGLPSSLWERSPYQLSGGQMRRVAIAGVLAMKPQVLILDEPSAGLDPIGKSHLLEMIYSLHQQEGFAVLHVTHDMNEAAQYADQMLVLAEGKLVLSGKTEILFQQDETLQSLGLDIPKSVQWVDKLNQKISSPLPRSLFTVEQVAEELMKRKKGSP
ncbi:energy-coupling factor transporter ATPase [Risungbinella massiliensis]|uniref:energy-coupling factor transporter ATPase n=1 Tax=Risungbinella massiliensis TaxID=1329796 RepID=UPI0005CBFB24|nr:energy-coupling factor transporter ATPase [Risungbinella massiliensis]